MMLHHYLIYHRAKSQLVIAIISYSRMQTFVNHVLKDKEKNLLDFSIFFPKAYNEQWAQYNTVYHTAKLPEEFKPH